MSGHPTSDSPWSPYHWALGTQAALLAHPRFAEGGLPADVERESEELVGFLRESCAALLDVTPRIDRLEAQQRAGVWTDADRAELRRLLAWHADFGPGIEARKQAYLAMLARHDLNSPPP